MVAKEDVVHMEVDARRWVAVGEKIVGLRDVGLNVECGCPAACCDAHRRVATAPSMHAPLHAASASVHVERDLARQLGGVSPPVALLENGPLDALDEEDDKA